MTSAQLQRSYLAAQERMDAHEARRDQTRHARPKAEWTLGDRIPADKHIERTKGGSK